MKVVLLPYMYLDGVPTFKDSSIMEMFDKMERDGTVGAVFFDGIVKTREDFLARMKMPGVQLYGIYVRDSSSPSTIAAIVWLDQFKQKTACGHFCVFSEFWKDAYKIGHKVLIQLLLMKNDKGEYALDAVYGFTPVDNELAIMAIKSAGMKEAGILPYAYWYESDKQSHHAVMSYFTRDEIPKEEWNESLY